MPTESTLAKKTKQELIQEYLKLTEAMDEARSTEAAAASQASIDFIAGIKSPQLDALSGSVADARRVIDEKLSEISRTARQELDQVIDQLSARRAEFEQLQKAIEISRQGLKATYNLELSAGALDALIQEYHKKDQEMEEAHRLKRLQFERESDDRQRNAEREQEEAAYRARREAVLREEEQKDVLMKRQKELSEKEQVLTARSEEVEEMKKSLEAANRLAETRLAEREMKVRELVESERKIDVSKREWEAERALFKLQIEQLEKEMKREQADNIFARKEAEAANKKAQDLAVRIIENSGRSSSESVKALPVASSVVPQAQATLKRQHPRGELPWG